MNTKVSFLFTLVQHSFLMSDCPLVIWFKNILISVFNKKKLDFFWPPVEVSPSTLRFYSITQWFCSATGSLWEMPDSNPGLLAHYQMSHYYTSPIYQRLFYLFNRLAFLIAWRKTVRRGLNIFQKYVFWQKNVETEACRPAFGSLREALSAVGYWLLEGALQEDRAGGRVSANLPHRVRPAQQCTGDTSSGKKGCQTWPMSLYEDWQQSTWSRLQ